MWSVITMVVAVCFAVAFVVGGVQGRESVRTPERHGKFGTSVITLDVGELPNADCWYEVTQTDNDGEPGGDKTVHVEPLCP